MNDIKWIKIATDMFDNRKIKQIEILPDGDAIIVIWVKILCLAGVINEDGCLLFTKEIPYTEELMATQFNRPINTIRLALKTFEQFGMIEVIDSVIRISNWEKYQNIEGMERVREQTRKRVANYRGRQKQALLEQGNVTETLRNATDIDKEKDIEGDIEKSKGAKAPKRFTPPTREEVQAYISEKGYNVDADKFIDYYTSKGWLVGKSPMKDWKAAVRSWSRNSFGNQNIVQKPKDKFHNFTERDYDYDALEKKLLGRK